MLQLKQEKGDNMEELFKRLKELKENKYNFEKVDTLKLTYDLLDIIGHKDGEVRDGLVYPVLAHLLHDDVLSNEELDKIANLFVTDNYLLFDMDNEVEYSVLRRSFTTLQLAILVYKHNQKQVLKDETFLYLVSQFSEYFKLEKDLRGYEESVGWLHSIAHSADLFAQIFKNEMICENLLESMFILIRAKFLIHHYQFVSDEDERMINAIENAISRNVLSQEFIKEWILGFKNYERGNDFPEAYYITFNVKKFMRSLYFRYLDKEGYGFLIEACKDVLTKAKI